MGRYMSRAVETSSFCRHLTHNDRASIYLYEIRNVHHLRISRTMFRPSELVFTYSILIYRITALQAELHASRPFNDIENHHETPLGKEASPNPSSLIELRSNSHKPHEKDCDFSFIQLRSPLVTLSV